MHRVIGILNKNESIYKAKVTKKPENIIATMKNESIPFDTNNEFNVLSEHEKYAFIMFSFHKLKMFPNCSDSSHSFQRTLYTIVLTCLNRKTETGVREFVRRGERSNFYSVGGSRLQGSVAVSDLVVAILATDREILHGTISEGVVRFHYL